MAFMVAVLPYLTAAVGVAGAISQSNNQQAQIKAQINADQMNADALKQQASVVNQQAAMAEDAQRKQARQLMGEQRAAIAESGTGLLASGNQRLVVQSAKAAEQDALNIRYGGLLEAHGLLAKSAQEEYQGRALKSQLGRLRTSGYLNAFASGLSGYTSSGGRFGGGGKKTTGGYYTGTGPD